MDLSLLLIKFTRILTIVLLILIIYYLINIGNNHVEERKRLKLREKKILPILMAFIFLILFFALLKKYTVLSETFFTIIFSAILAYIFNPLINYLEKKKINRGLGVLILYLGIIGFFLIFAFLVIPRSSMEIKRLITNMPIYMERITASLDESYNRYYDTLGDLPPLFHGVQQVVMENIIGLEEMVINGVKNFLGAIMKSFSKLISLILTPILTFYFLLDKDHFKSKLISLIPGKYRRESRQLFQEIDQSLSKFVRGKLILAAYVAIATSLVLIIMDVEFALVIGFITGVADVIPYIGPFLGFLPAVFFAYLNNPIKALWIGIIFILIQWVENNILAPKIIGDTVGIHPLIILISIIIGGGIFGVLGMILAVPFVAVSLIIFSFLTSKLGNPKD